MYRREFLKGSSVSALSLLSGCAPTSASKPASQVRASRHTGKPAASLARSLWPVAMQRKEQIRDAVFGEIGKTTPLNFMVRQGRYKWFTFADSHYQVVASEYLYDLAEDPYEMRNLIDSADHQNILTNLKLRHLEYFKHDQWNWAAGSLSLYEKHGASPVTAKKADKARLSESMYEKFKKIQGL